MAELFPSRIKLSLKQSTHELEVLRKRLNPGTRVAFAPGCDESRERQGTFGASEGGVMNTKVVATQT
jgi:hypothetical protein